jgi:hypothetical protein
MPTGYTATLMEEGQSFPEFVILCARAMGACIEMRDESLDAKIPDRFEPSTYHTERSKEAKARLAELKKMTNAERIAFGEARRKEAVKSCEQWIAKRNQENGRLNEMEQKVRAWQPPTKDHVRFKEFMLEQLNISKNETSYPDESLKEAKAKKPVSYYAEAVKQAERDITYHAEEHAKEVQRANERSEWVQQLRASI